MLIGWLLGARRQGTQPSDADVEIRTLEAMWSRTSPIGAPIPADADGFECAGCGGRLVVGAWRFCGWCGSALDWSGIREDASG